MIYIDLIYICILIVFSMYIFGKKWEIIFLSPPILIIIYDNICYIPFIDKKFSIPWIFFVYHTLALFIFVLIIFYLKFKRIKLKYSLFKKNSYYILYLYIVFSLYIIYLIIQKSGFGSILNLLGEFNRFYALVRGTGEAGSAFLLFLLFPVFLIPSIFLISGRIKLFWTFIIVILPILLFTGARTILMIHLLYNFILYFILYGNKKILFNLFIALFLVIIIGTLFRSGFSLMNVDEYMNTFGLLDLNNLFVLSDSIKYSENKLLYGYTLYDIFIWLIPRGIWPDKPISTIGTYELYPYVAERGTNYTFGLYGNAIINFGEIGSLFIVMIFIFLFTILFYKIYIVYKYKKYNNNFLYLILLYSFIIFFIRAGIFTHFWIIYIYYSTFLYIFLSSIRMEKYANPK